MSSCCMATLSKVTSRSIQSQMIKLQPIITSSINPHDQVIKPPCLKSDYSKKLEEYSPSSSRRYTSNNMILLKLALKNTLLKIGGRIAVFAKKTLIIRRIPRSTHRRRPRHKAFQIRPSRLSIMSSNAQD